MMTELFRGLPAGVVMGALLAGALAHYAGGELGERRANRLYGAACVQTAAQASQGGDQLNKLREQFAQQILGRMKRTYGPLWQVMERQFNLDAMVNQATAARRLQLSRRTQAAVQTAVGRCQCAIRIAVREDAGLAHAIYVGSLRLVQPASVRNIDKGIVGVLRSGRCGKGA